MLGSLVMVLVVALSGTFTDVIDLDLSAQSYDRTLFRPNLKQSLGRWEVKHGSLQAIIPKGPVGRPPISFVGLFELEGDFEISADYQLVALPKPAATSAKNRGDVANTVEIVISGPAGWCVVSRKHLPMGERISCFGELGGMRKFISELFPVSGSAGRLEARREGEIIHFYRTEGGGPEVEIGSIPFGSGPVSEVSLQVYAMNTTDALDVRFSSLHVGAYAINRSLGGTSSRRPILTWALVLAGMVGGAFAVRRFAVRRRAAPSPVPNT